MDLEAKIKHQVSSAVRRFQMFDRSQKILVGISGGKDSLALTAILKALNYQVSGLMIDLEIPEFSGESLLRSREFLSSLGVPLHVVKASEETGYSMPQAREKYPGHLCAVCGTLKRRIFNAFSRKHGFSVFCTGHHLDDEAANLLADNLRWDWEYLKKCHPVLEEKKGFVKRAKPFCLTRESDILAYAQTAEIPFVPDPCPYSQKGSRHKYEFLLRSMDQQFPGAVTGYYLQFLKKSGFLKAVPEAGLELRPCPSCGEMTANGICRICLMISGDWKR